MFLRLFYYICYIFIDGKTILAFKTLCNGIVLNNYRNYNGIYIHRHFLNTCRKNTLYKIFWAVDRSQNFFLLMYHIQ